MRISNGFYSKQLLSASRDAKNITSKGDKHNLFSLAFLVILTDWTNFRVKSTTRQSVFCWTYFWQIYETV